MSSTVRSVTVRMNAEVAQYIADMKLAGKATDEAFSKGHAGAAGYNRDLDATSKELDKATTNTRRLDQQTSQLSQQMRSGGSELDRYSGRLGLLTTGLVAIGPAAIPITAAAIPAVAGLAAGLGAAAGAAGVFALATHGISDALKALDTYQLEPTDAHLQALNESMAALGPSGRDFVRFLDQIEPKLKGLQDAAEAGLLPGATTGLKQTLTLLPQVRDLVISFSNELGNLTGDAGKHLSSDSEFQGFLHYLQTDGAPTMHAFAVATGDVVAGLTQLFVDLAPANRTFTQDIVAGGRAFRQWADNVDDTEGFQRFLAYIQTEGPEVGELLVAVATALLNIVQAAAPVGSTVLPILTDVAKILGAIAASPIGPSLFEGIAAMLIFNRAAGAMSGVLGSVGAQGTTLEARMSSLGSTMSTAAGRSQLLGSALRGVAGVGGMAALTLGAHSSNDAIQALSRVGGGALLGFGAAGPIGAAVGAGAGLIGELAIEIHRSATESAFAATDIGSLTSSYQGLAAAVTDASKAQVLADLHSSKNKPAEAAFSDSGISDRTAIAATLGNAKALADIEAILNERLTQANSLYAQADVMQAKNPYLWGAAAAKMRDQADALNSGNDAIESFLQLGPDLQSQAQRNAAAVHDYSASFKTLPKQVKLDFKSNVEAGLLTTNTQLAHFVKDHNLSPAQVKVLIDEAGFHTSVGRVESALKNLADTPVTVVIRTLTENLSASPTKPNTTGSGSLADLVGAGAKIPRTHAAGGYISGPGTATSDSVLAYLSNGEYVMRASAVQRYGAKFFDGLNAERFAKGGPVASNANGVITATISPADIPGLADHLNKASKSLDGLSDSADKTGKKLEHITIDGKKHKIEPLDTVTNKDFKDLDIGKSLKTALGDLSITTSTTSSDIKQAFDDFGAKINKDGLLASKGLQATETKAEGLATQLEANGVALNGYTDQYGNSVEGLIGKLQDAESAFDSIASTVTSIFRPDVFGSDELTGQETSWGGKDLGTDANGNQLTLAQVFGQDFVDQINAQNRVNTLNTSTNQANQFSADLTLLKAMGLTGPAFDALASSGDVKAADYYVANPGALAAFENAYAADYVASGGAGQNAATLADNGTIAVLKQQIDATNASTQAITGALNQLLAKNDIDRIGRVVGDSAGSAAAAAVVAGIGAAASSAVQRGK